MAKVFESIEYDFLEELYSSKAVDLKGVGHLRPFGVLAWATWHCVMTKLTHFSSKCLSNIFFNVSMSVCFDVGVCVEVFGNLC